MTGDNNGWGEYSRLVLKELETLAKGIDGLKAQIGDLKSEIAELKAKEDKVKELSAWKERIDEVASPTQLKEMQDMVKKHELFKTKAITMFAVVQIMMAGLMTILKFFMQYEHNQKHVSDADDAIINYRPVRQDIAKHLEVSQLLLF